jgi:hypothetical protein
MKFETVLLHSLFVACFAVCALIMGAMLTTHTQIAHQASNTSVADVLLASPAHCAMRPDGVMCPTVRG